MVTEERRLVLVGSAGLALVELEFATFAEGDAGMGADEEDEELAEERLEAIEEAGEPEREMVMGILVGVCGRFAEAANFAALLLRGLAAGLGRPVLGFLRSY